MADTDIVWPVGTTNDDPDLSARPMLFHPKGFLVAALTDADEAERAAAALRAVGFLDRELRIFTGQQIVDDHIRYTQQKGLLRRVVTTFTDDPDTLELYHGHARDGRAALWVRVIDDDEANRAIRGLAGCTTLHIRHYGHHAQRDFYLRRPSR